MSQGKKSETSVWIKDYLKSQNVDISNWESYGPLYNRYSARIRKYNPQNYQQFLNLCTFQKQRKNHSGGKDLGDWQKELGGWKKKVKPEVPEVPEVPGELKVPTFHPSFNEERWIRDEKKDFEAWKKRCQHYRDGRITNTTQSSGETGRLKDRMPYIFRYAMKCLGGTYPIECFPEVLNDYKEELLELLNSQRENLNW